MIHIDRLCKSYGPVQALSDVSLSVTTGEIVGLLGPNGAGKTTAMKIVTCYMPPSSGSVSVDGVDVLADPLAVRQRIGYLPEHNPLYLDMSVDEYLKFSARLHRIPAGEHGAAIRKAIHKCGLDEYRHRLIGHLSKGYRQRVGLAQAILHDPDVLVLDEPTTGLDPNQILEIRSLIKELGREKTVILSTHIMQEVQAVCSRVLIINRGRIVADDTADNLLAQRSGKARFHLVLGQEAEAAGVEQTLRSSFQLDSLESRQKGSEREFVMSSLGSEDLRNPLFKLAGESGWPLLELKRSQNTLEDVFRELTTDGAEVNA